MSTGNLPVAPAGDRNATEAAFFDGLGHVARRILLGARGLSTQDRDFLYDLSRADERNQFKSLRRLLQLSARCARPEDAEAFPELLRTLIVAQRDERINALTAFELETEAQAMTDVAQFQYMRNPCRTTKERLVDAFKAHIARSKAALDAVIAA